jgi:O-antigen/teichoic acid export membrane protein
MRSPPAAASAVPRARHLLGVLTGRGDHAAVWSRAGSAFGIRVASAALVLLTQILLARWMGAHEFGRYVYAWTLVIIVGDLAPIGFPATGQKLVAAYRQTGDFALLRGFLFASRLFTVGIALVAALLAVAAVRLAAPYLSNTDPLVVAIAAMALPAYAVGNMLDSISRSFDRVHLGLLPVYIGRPLALIGLIGAAHVLGFTTDAASAMTAAVISTCLISALQYWLVMRLVAANVPPGPLEIRFGAWLKVSAEIFVAWCFITLFNYADVLVLNAFVTPDKVGIYYASVKTLAVTSFIAYAVAAVFGHKFVERHVAGDREGLAAAVAFAVRWTFWPSLALTGLILLAGRPILGLFGRDFQVGYELLFVLSIGLLARAAVGPAERLLTLLGEQRLTAGLYAVCFLVNLTLALVLVPRFELIGAAAAVAGATFVEAVLLAVAVRRRLGLSVFVLPLKAAASRREAVVS